MYLVMVWRGSEDTGNKKLAYRCHTPEGMEVCIGSQGPLWNVVFEEMEKEKKEKQNVFICDNVHISVSTLPSGLQPTQDSTNRR